ncbi:regulating synaptic membrane exocytosis protein 2-like [Oscarella lobularis]|uniref:regulating synaptic membrane exocytosis protein 2-like n=1 Tax=Oscarella lobularis TaxID=121494 RepID=UPI003313E2D5
MEMAAYLPTQRPTVIPHLPPSAPASLDLRGLSANEIARIQQVLTRADRANRVVAERTNKLKAEFDVLKEQVEAARRRATEWKDQKRLCQICFQVDVGSTSVSHTCCLCRRKFCSRSNCGCRTKTSNKRGTPMEWTCALCYKEHQYMTLSGNWIVTNRRLSSETVSPISPRPNPIASRPIIDSSSSESLGTGCCGDSEMGPCGRILIQLGYIEAQSSFIFTIICAEGLHYSEAKDRKCAINPYAKAYLLPDRSERMKRKTATLHDTNNPVWKRAFKYENISLEELRSRSLEVSLWSHKKQKPMRLKKHLGQVAIDLSKVTLTNLPQCYPLSSDGTWSSPIRHYESPQRFAPQSPISARNSWSSVESSGCCSIDESVEKSSVFASPPPAETTPSIHRKKGLPLGKLGQIFSLREDDDVDRLVMEYKLRQQKCRRISEMEEVEQTLRQTTEHGSCSLGVPEKEAKTASLPRSSTLNIPGDGGSSRRSSVPILSPRARSASPAPNAGSRGRLSVDNPSSINPLRLSPRLRKSSRASETYSLSPSEDGSAGSSVSALHPSEGCGLGVGQLLRSAQIGVDNSGQIQLGFSLTNRRLEITIFSATDLVYKSDHLTFGQANPPYAKLYLLHDTKPVSGQKEQRTKWGDCIIHPRFDQTLTFKMSEIQNKILKVKVKYDTSKKAFKCKSNSHEIGQALIALDDLQLREEEEVRGWYRLFPSQN